MPNPFDQSLTNMDPLPSDFTTGDLLYVVRNGQPYKLDDLSSLNTISQVTVIITSAEMLDSFNNPVVLVDAAAGKYINPVFVTMKNIAGGAAYAAPNITGIWHESGTKSLYEFDNNIITTLTPVAEAAAIRAQRAYVLNDNLVLKTANAAPTLGTNEFIVNVWYTLID